MSYASKQVRVLALADRMGYPDGRVHGGTTYFLNTFPPLSRAGVDLTVAFMSYPHPKSSVLRENGIEPVFFSSPKWDFRAYRDLNRLLGERQIQVMHLMSFKSQFLGRLAGPGHNCASMIHIHDTVRLSPMVKLMQRSVAGRTDLAIAVSDAAGALAVTDYGLPKSLVRTVHNGIDIQRFANPPGGARTRVREELGISGEAPVVGCIGRLFEMKGHRYAVEAMPQVRRTLPDARLVIVGDGPLRTELAQLVEASKLHDVVTFTGERNDIPEVLAALDIVAMPSISGEGMPYAAIEAIAAGRPVVAFPTAGIPEVVVHDRTGLLVESASVTALASGIVQLLGDRVRREKLGAMSRQHAQNFTTERHIDELASIYESLAVAHA